MAVGRERIRRHIFGVSKLRMFTLSKHRRVVPRQYMPWIEAVTALDDLPAAVPTPGLGENARFSKHLTARILRPSCNDTETVTIGPARGFTFSPFFFRQSRQTAKMGSRQFCVGGIEAGEACHDLLDIVATISK